MFRAPLRLRFLPLAALLALAAAASGCGSSSTGKAESVAAFAGAAGGPGFFDGSPADPVRFDSPEAVAVTTTGDIFVADTENHVIRKIDDAGNVTAFAGSFGAAGSDDGTGAAARFDSPTGIVAVGVILFVCDTGNHTIRRISVAGEVTTVAGTPGTAGFADNAAGPGGVLFSSPGGITSDGALLSTRLFVADTGNHRIRRLFLSGATETIAGSGTPGFADNPAGLSARFDSPGGVAFDGSALFVADTLNHAIRRITPAAVGGNVDTLAGDGVPGFIDDTSGLSARFSSPRSLIFAGGVLFVADAGNHVVREVDTTNFGFTTTLAGSPQVPGFADGSGAAAGLRGPAGLGIQSGVSSLFFLADKGNHLVRQVTVAGDVTTVAGTAPHAGSANGPGDAARFDGPAGAAVIGDNVFVADTNNHTIRKITSAGDVTTLAGLAGTPGTTDDPPRFRFPGGVAALGSDLFVADSRNHTIRKVTAAGVVTTLAGSPGATGVVDDTGSAARFNNPQGIVALGGDLYVADTGNHTVRKVTAAGVVTTLAGLGGTPGSTDGTGGVGGTARFDSPQGIAAIGTNLFVADTGNHTVRRVTTPSGLVTTFAGSAGEAGFADAQGDSARFSSPAGIGAIGSVLYVADPGNHAVRTISTTRTVRTFAGSPDAATTRDGDASAALLNAPAGVAGVEGTLYFTDTNENVVRKILF